MGFRKMFLSLPHCQECKLVHSLPLEYKRWEKKPKQVDEGRIGEFTAFKKHFLTKQKRANWKSFKNKFTCFLSN